MKNGAMTLFAAGLGGVPSFVTYAADTHKIIIPTKKIKYSFVFFNEVLWMV